MIAEYEVFSPDRPQPALTKVISGGQTGVDRAALMAVSAVNLRNFHHAHRFQLQVGGWCPKGRRAEDGPVDPVWNLQETPSELYPQRTEWNVRDSDATLVIHCGGVSGGTRKTVDYCLRLAKPYLLIDLQSGGMAASQSTIVDWLGSPPPIKTLNVAGPRESKHPGIYDQARALLVAVFTDLFPMEAAE